MTFFALSLCSYLSSSSSPSTFLLLYPCASSWFKCIIWKMSSVHYKLHCSSWNLNQVWWYLTIKKSESAKFFLLKLMPPEWFQYTTFQQNTLFYTRLRIFFFIYSERVYIFKIISERIEKSCIGIIRVVTFDTNVSSYWCTEL